MGPAASDSIFIFDRNKSLATNFLIWHDLDSKDRDVYGEPPLSRLEAIKLFASIYKASAVAIQDELEVEARRFGFKP